ncbi:MAG: M50 family metallopeptidase [Deltaproteobacteria bacterium]|nr:M50 family metallopeptidase [Deltaproteobacteria bacterium]
MASPEQRRRTTDQLTVRFNLLGIPVSLQPSFWIVTFLLGTGGRSWAFAGVWLAASLASILFHELGHALVARAVGRQARIDLHAMGGTTYASAPPLPATQNILFALAGPAAGVLLGAMTWSTAALFPSVRDVPLADQLYRDLLWVNWGYSLLNLLPILPLDGGLVMQTLVRHATRKPTSVVPAFISVAAAALVSVLAYANSWTWALVLFAWLALAHVPTVKQALDTWRDARLVPAAADLDAAWTARDGALLLTRAEEMLRVARSGALRAKAVASLAWAHLLLGKPEAAQQALERMPPGFEAGAWLAGSILLDLGRFDDVIALISAVPEAQRPAELTRLLILTHATRGAFEDTMVAFRAARSFGFSAEFLTLLGSKLCRAARYAEAEEVYRWWFSIQADGTSAYGVACCRARLGDPNGALEWLQNSVASGWKNAAHTLADEDLATLRDEAPFKALVARMADAAPN